MEVFFWRRCRLSDFGRAIRSFLLPAIMMTTVPMGMVGVIIVLAVTHTYFSIQAAIGCIL